MEYKSFFQSKNPFWQHASARLYLAQKNNTIVGRIAAIVDDVFTIPEADRTGFFGFFESINDPEVATALFHTAENWLKQQQCTLMIGPINGRFDNGIGFLIKGFDNLQPLLCLHNPPYYPLFAEHYGMKKIRDFYLYHLDLTSPLPKDIQKEEDTKIQNNIAIRPFNRWHTNKELSWWIPLLKEIFSPHWGYVPASDEEVRNRFGIKQARWFIDTDLFLVAEKKGNPIAFHWSTPEYNQLFQQMKGKIGPRQILHFFLNQRAITKGRMNYAGIKKDARSQGLGSRLTYHIIQEMKKRKYTAVICGPIDEKNSASLRMIEKTGAKHKNTYRIFQKKIT